MTYIATFINKFAKSFLYYITLILPKNNRIVLRGFPDYEDSLLSIFRELSNKKPTPEIIWILDRLEKNRSIEMNDHIKSVKRGSLLDIYYSTTSRYIFITHGHFLTKIPPNQYCINLWHGIPLKKIGTDLSNFSRKDTLLLATSSFTRDMFSACFKLNKDRILISGQPRTDIMLQSDKLKTLDRIFNAKELPKKVLLWMPTFRQTSYFKEKIDGKVSDNIFNCSDFCPDKFNDKLIRADAVCIVKPHPMAIRQKQSEQSNILYIDEEWLKEHRITLYELIGAADCLISDISSVVIDYLLLDRPVILLFEDIKEYERTRGFTLNPIEEYLPAPVMSNFEEFINELNYVLNDQDRHKKRRQKLKALFFEHHDADATTRVLDEVFGKERWD